MRGCFNLINKSILSLSKYNRLILTCQLICGHFVLTDEEIAFIVHINFHFFNTGFDFYV